METRLLIAGEQVEGDGARLAVENPATEETLAEVRAASSEQVEAAIAAARSASRGWGEMPAAERADLLHEVATRLRANADELARAMTLEGGKPLIENSDEVGWTAAAFDYYAEMGRNFAGRVIPPIESSQLALILKQPLGVVGAIVPWNYPLLLLAWKLAPALAAGNAVVCKPSELTPISTLMLAPCLDHLPPGVVRLSADRGDRIPRLGMSPTHAGQASADPQGTRSAQRQRATPSRTPQTPAPDDAPLDAPSAGLPRCPPRERPLSPRRSPGDHRRAPLRTNRQEEPKLSSLDR